MDGKTVVFQVKCNAYFIGREWHWIKKWGKKINVLVYSNKIHRMFQHAHCGKWRMGWRLPFGNCNLEDDAEFANRAFMSAQTKKLKLDSTISKIRTRNVDARSSENGSCEHPTQHEISRMRMGEQQSGTQIVRSSEIKKPECKDE